MRKPVVLTFLDYYLPGYKFGGPVRTIANLVEHLGDELAFRIVTRNHDFHERRPYADWTGGWRTVGKADVLYLPRRQLTLHGLASVINQTPHDVLYLNSFFSPRFTVLPLILRRLGVIPRRPTVLAPRGELTPAALRGKWLKKRFYMAATHAMGLCRGLQWQASTELELADIRRRFGHWADVRIARNLPTLDGAGPEALAPLAKTPGTLKVVYLSRISRMKNLEGALRLLEGLAGRLELHIYGPYENRAYWDECRRLIRGLPANVSVEDHGPVANEQVPAILAQHHLFLLPTLGENFGHVILEALRAGCPVLLSDRTPWRGLETAGVGWDLPLEEPQHFRAVLQRCIEMDQDAFDRLSRAARRYGQAAADDRAVREANCRLFQLAPPEIRRAA